MEKKPLCTDEPLYHWFLDKYMCSILLGLTKMLLSQKSKVTGYVSGATFSILNAHVYRSKKSSRKTSIRCNSTSQNYPHAEFNCGQDLVNILLFNCILCTLFAWHLLFSLSLVGWLCALLACPPFFFLLKPSSDSLEKNSFSQWAGVSDLFTSELHYTFHRSKSSTPQTAC